MSETINSGPSPLSRYLQLYLPSGPLSLEEIRPGMYAVQGNLYQLVTNRSEHRRDGVQRTGSEMSNNGTTSENS